MTSQLNLTDYGLESGVVAWGTVSAVEWFAVACGSLVCLIILSSSAWIFYKRSYPPIKATQWPLMLASGIAGVLFWVGSVASIRIFPNTGVFLQNCTFFTIWLTYTFGLFVLIEVMLFRMLRLYWLLILRRESTNLSYYGSLVVLFIYPLAWGSVGTAMKLDGPLIDTMGIPTCQLNTQFQYAIYAFMALEAVAFIYLTFALRACPKRWFNEYRLNIVTTLVFVICFIIEAIVTGVQAQNDVWGRVVFIFCVLIGVSIVFFVYVAIPIYHSIVDPVEYEKRFWSELNAEVEKASADRKKVGAPPLSKDSTKDSSVLSGSKDERRFSSLTMEDGKMSQSAMELLNVSSNEHPAVTEYASV